MDSESQSLNGNIGWKCNFWSDIFYHWTHIIVTDVGVGNVGIFINRGNGTFFSEVAYSNGASAFLFSVVDVNGDNKPDIILFNASTNTAGVLFNVGNGTFLPEITCSTGSEDAGSSWRFAASPKFRKYDITRFLFLYLKKTKIKDV